jgi:hypothetical protein
MSRRALRGVGFEPEARADRNPYMKLNGTIPNKKVIFRDTIPGVEDFRNLKFQAPNSNEILNFNIQ